VTLLRAERLLLERPVARNPCAGFWGPQRTPTKAELRASLLCYCFRKIKFHTRLQGEPVWSLSIEIATSTAGDDRWRA
jgi:hypothetical protein